MASSSDPVAQLTEWITYIIALFFTAAGLYFLLTLTPFEGRMIILYYLFIFAVIGILFLDILVQVDFFNLRGIGHLVFIILIFLISIISSFMAFMEGYAMVTTLVFISIWYVVVFKEPHVANMLSRVTLVPGPHLLVFGITVLFTGFILQMLGVGFGIFSGLIGPYPPNIMFVFGIGCFVYPLTHGISGFFASASGASVNDQAIKAIALLMTVMVAGSFFFYWTLEGDWNNMGQVGGDVFAGATNTLSSGINVVSSQIEAYTNVQLNPSRNPTFARMQCSMSIYFGGGVIGETDPDQLIQNCVDDKLGRNETEAESDRVTEPVRLQVEEIEVEPYSDEVNVVVPLLNNLVRDINGRTIDVEAADIYVDIQMQRNGDTRASLKAGTGDSHGEGERYHIEQLPSGGDQIVEYAFPTFSIVGTYTDSLIEQQLLNFQECKIEQQNAEEGEGPNCENQLNWFTSAFSSNDLTRERVAYVNRAREVYSGEDNGVGSAQSHGIVAEGDDVDVVPRDVWTRQNTIAPNREYTINVQVEYEFQAEAAFTQASRWRSGNYLLELWDPEAWGELSFDDREAWESQNCNAVTRYGQQVERQRTAALTTPVVPVMYTECGNTLFRNDNYYEDLDIMVGATVNPDHSDGLNQNQGFKIDDAITDCGDESEEPITDKIGGETDEEGWYVHQEGVGFVVNPANVNRTIDEIAGDTMTIACRTVMDFTINFESQRSYEVPNLQ